MTVRSELEIAETALRQALITALNEKQDGQLSKIFDALANVKSILREYPLTFTNYTEEWYNKMNFNLTSNVDLNTGAVKSGFGDDVVINFPTPFPSASSPDTISLG
jgi:hypothetical protein